MLMSTKIPGLFEKEKPGKHGIFSLGFSRFSRKPRNRERAKSAWNYSQPAPGSCAQNEKPRKRGIFSLGFSKRFQAFQETPESRKSQGHVDPLSSFNQFTPFLSRPPTPFGPPSKLCEVLLAIHVFLVYYFELSRENMRKQRKELATYPYRMEPRVPGNSRVNSLLYGKARSVRALWALQEFLEKPRKPRINFPRFPGLSLCAKKPGGSD